MVELFKRIFGNFSVSSLTSSSIIPRVSLRRSRSIERRNIYVLRGFLVFLALSFLIWKLGYWQTTIALLTAPVLFAVTIGGVVGGVELLGRYRYAPLRAVFTPSGFFYVLINFLAAWAAYYMIEQFNVLEKTTVAKTLTHVLLAGFGSLVFMRSSFFKIRVGESDIGIGPSVVLDTLLLVADRGVDRREAVERAQDIASLVSEVSDTQLVAKMLTKYCLALMQNVDDKTSQQVTESIDKIMADPLTPDQIKLDVAALQLGNVVGPDVLEAALEALGNRLQSKTLQKDDNNNNNQSALTGAPDVNGADGTPSKEDLIAEIAKNRNE